MRDLFSMFIATPANFLCRPPVSAEIDLYLLIQAKNINNEEYQNLKVSRV